MIMGYYTEYGYMLNGILYATDTEAFEAEMEE
jgi:hypothetical protein